MRSHIFDVSIPYRPQDSIKITHIFFITNPPYEQFPDCSQGFTPLQPWRAVDCVSKGSQPQWSLSISYSLWPEVQQHKNASLLSSAITDTNTGHRLHASQLRSIEWCNVIALVVSMKEIYGWLLIVGHAWTLLVITQLQPCAPLGLLPEIWSTIRKIFRHNVRMLENRRSDIHLARCRRPPKNRRTPLCDESSLRSEIITFRRPHLKFRNRKIIVSEGYGNISCDNDIGSIHILPFLRTFGSAQVYRGRKIADAEARTVSEQRIKVLFRTPDGDRYDRWRHMTWPWDSYVGQATTWCRLLRTLPTLFVRVISDCGRLLAGKMWSFVHRRRSLWPWVQSYEFFEKSQRNFLQLLHYRTFPALFCQAV